MSENVPARSELRQAARAVERGVGKGLLLLSKGIAALATVIAQGVLGGLTVLFFLPAAVSTAHAGQAEIFLCLTVAIALFTSLERWPWISTTP